MQINRLKQLFKSPFAQLYKETNMLQIIQRSLKFVLVGNICSKIFAVITTGSAIAGYAKMLGASDLVFGILTAVPFFATLMQLPVAGIVSRKGNRKKILVTYGVISRSLWIIIGLVPFFMPIDPSWLRVWSVIFLICISSLSGSTINVCYFSWLADLVPINIRGRWISYLNRIIYMVSIAIGLLTAYILDSIPGYAGYALVFVIGGLIGVIDICCYIWVEDVPMQISKNPKFFVVCKQMIHDKPFFRFMMFWTVWLITSYMASPYTTYYALGKLKLSFMQVTLCGQIAGGIVTILIISHWGRIIDRYGNKLTMWISCIATSLSPGILLFSQAGGLVSFLLYSVIGAAFWDVPYLVAQNMLLANSPDDQRPSYIAIYSCFTSIAGSFVGVLIGGVLLQWIPNLLEVSHITIMGQTPDQYKILFVLSVVARLTTVLIFVPGLKNDKEVTFTNFKDDVMKKLRG